VVLFICVAAAGALWVLKGLQDEVSIIYGEPAAELNPLTRVFYSARLLTSQDKLLLSKDSAGGEQVFEIRQGESVGSVAYRLENAGLVPQADSFRIFLIYSGLDRSLQAGKYKLSPAVVPVEIARQLQDATPAEVIFAILPGWRLEEAAASLPTSGLTIDPDAFVQVAQTFLIDHPIDGGSPQNTSLEGFLFPREYLLPREAGIEQVLAAAVSGLNSAMTTDLEAGFRVQGLDLYQAVTLASIVQREAMVEAEQPMIASVFYNRLASGMKLDSDPTAQYALGYNSTQNTWWTNPLTTADLQIDSPYNTYLYPGLPPTPISSPGLAALRAVAFPASSPYYYFRAKCDGSGQHSFAVTFEEHLNNACQ